MANKVIMPKQGLQMTEGTILKWLVAEGGACAENKPLFEMETDKLTITIDSPASGTLLKIVRGEGETVPITETIAIIGQPGEDIGGLVEENAAPEAVTAATSAPDPVPAPVAAPQKTAPGGKVFITPRARMQAERLGVDYTAFAGSAPDGTIIERDILAACKTAATPLARKEAAAAGIPLGGIAGTGANGKVTREDVRHAAAAASGTGPTTLVPLSGMRRVIAKRMKESLNINAQTTHTVSVRMTEARRMREVLKASGVKVSYNDIIARCTVRALTEYPMMNARFTDEGILQMHYVNLGMAVAVDEGLLVPVIKNAEAMSLVELNEATAYLASRARTGKLASGDLSGGTFTISNLGMFGLDEFVAIINPPECGILAVGAVLDTPVAVDGAVEIHPVVRLTLSYDHRIVDGAPAARFIMRVKELLETPALLL